ncbi:MAG: hypothetical protein ABI811_21435 [Acidobacteriota bacterium]
MPAGGTASVIAWMFLLFTATMGGMLYLHFFFAHRCWRRVRGVEAEDIDSNYVRREDYFGQSFRAKLHSWMELPTTALPDGMRAIQHGSERIELGPGRSLADRSKSDDVLVIEGDFSCGSFCQLGREIYAQRNVVIGQATECQAIAADGDISLGPDVQVSRWVDCWGTLRLAKGSIVHSRASSRTAAHLELGAQALSVFAPEIIIGAVAHLHVPPVMESSAAESSPERVAIPPDSDDSREALKKAGVDPEKFRSLSADCWIYQGSLRPTSAVRVTSHLVVRGDCDIPAGSLLEHDVKASRNLRIGADSECQANLIAEKSLSVGARVRFSGVIHANEEILLGPEVRGESGSGPVAVDAGSWLYVEEGVSVHGKLSSGERVRVVDTAFAESWRKKFESWRDRS